MTTPRHLELFIRENKTVAQCRTETNGRLDDPVSIAVAGPEWTTFLSAWNQTQAAEIAALTAERDALQTSLATMTANRDAQKAIADSVPGLTAQVQSLTTDKTDLTTQLATVTGERDVLRTQADTVPALQEQLATLTAEKAALQAEVERLATLVPLPVPDAFLSADWPRFRTLILSDEAVQRVATGNPTAWPLMVLYLAQFSSQPSRGVDIAQLWTMLEQNTPITPEEVQRINAIATDCGVPLQMNDDGSIG